MAEAKEASMDLKSELAELEGLDGNLDTTTDVSADLVEMKNRMDKSDQEMRAMTDAMKSTLLDVRTLMQDMDNPFNMLRDMGVDKLVSKAVETVEEEVNQKKNDDAKNKMAGVDEGGSQSPVIAKIEGSTTNHPGVVSNQPAMVSPQTVQPAPAPVSSSVPIQAQAAAPIQTPIATPVQAVPATPVQAVPATPSQAPAVASTQAPVATPVQQVPLQPSAPAQGAQTVNAPANQSGAILADEAVQTGSTTGISGASVPSVNGVNSVQSSGEQIQQIVGSPDTSVGQSGLITQTPAASATSYAANPVPQYTHLEERIYQTEETVNNLASSVGELVKTIRTQRKPKTNQVSYAQNPLVDNGYYESYVGLVADYMYLRLGDQGAEELLLEGMYKEWASPHVVRDIMDKLSGKRKRKARAENEEANIEDRMLLTTLLRNLDKPPSQWSESTHLFMLMALVSRAKENTS